MADWMLRIAILLSLAMPSLAQEDTDDGIEIDKKPPADEAEESKQKTLVRPPTKGKRKGWLRFEDVSGKYAIELPEAWQSEPYDPGDGVLGFRWWLAGSETQASLRLVADNYVLDARAAPRYGLERFQRTYKKATLEPRYDPLPHIHWHGEGRAGAIVFLQIKGNGLCVQLECGAKDYAGLEADVMTVAATVTADVEIWPAIPKEYVKGRKGSFLIARHPSVKGSIAYVHKVLRSAESRFKSVHGVLPRSDRPIVVLVHSTKLEACTILKEAGEEATFADFWVGRIFTLPITRKDEGDAIRLAGATHAVLAVAKYGDIEPSWFYVGERELAGAAFLTGKPLPYMHEGYVDWNTDVEIQAFDAMPKLGSALHEDFGKQSFFYVCMFHAGKYKKAYRRFLKDYAENHDPGAAFDRHILPIGYVKLRKAASDFAFNRMRPFKPKK